MKKFVLLLGVSFLLFSCTQKSDSESGGNSSSPDSSSVITDPSTSSSEEEIYDDYPPLVYCSFDNVDQNGNYYDEISGNAFYSIGDVPSVTGKHNNGGFFDGESMLSIDCDLLPRHNEEHTVMAYIKLDRDTFNPAAESNICGWGKYQNLSDTRLMIYHGELCITSYNVCTFCAIPNEMFEEYVNLTMVYEHNVYSLYINGVFKMSVRAQSGIDIKDGPLCIGGFGSNIINFNGYIDEVYAFDVALAQDELELYMNNQAKFRKAQPNNEKPTRNGVEAFEINNFKKYYDLGWNYFEYINGNTILSMALYMPFEYDDETPTRFLTFLHGDGSNGQTAKDVISNTEATTVQMTLEQYENTIILVCCAGSPWLNVPNDAAPSSTRYPYKSYSMIDDAVPSRYLISLIKLMQEIENNLCVDMNKIYISGYSRGTMACWYLLNKFPTKYAAAILCCGAGDPHIAHTICETPIWLFHGTNDPLVDINGARDIIQAIRDEGGNPNFTEMQGSDHNFGAKLKNISGLLEWFYGNVNTRNKGVNYGLNSVASDWDINEQSDVYNSITSSKKFFIFKDKFFEGGTIEWDMKVNSASYEDVAGLVIGGRKLSMTGTANGEAFHVFGKDKDNNFRGLSFENGTKTIETNAVLENIQINNPSEYVHYKLIWDAANARVKLVCGDRQTDWVNLELNFDGNKFLGIYAASSDVSIKNIQIVEERYDKLFGYEYGVGGATAWEINESEQSFKALTSYDQILMFRGKVFTGGTIEWDMKIPSNNYRYGTVCGLIIGANKQHIVSSEYGEDYYVFGRHASNVFVGFSKNSGAFAWENTNQLNNIAAPAGEGFYHYKLDWDSKNNAVTLYFGSASVTYTLNQKYGGNKYFGIYTEVEGTVIKNIEVINN